MCHLPIIVLNSLGDSSIQPKRRPLTSFGIRSCNNYLIDYPWPATTTTPGYDWQLQLLDCSRFVTGSETSILPLTLYQSDESSSNVNWIDILVYLCMCQWKKQSTILCILPMSRFGNVYSLPKDLPSPTLTLPNLIIQVYPPFHFRPTLNSNDVSTR